MAYQLTYGMMFGFKMAYPLASFLGSDFVFDSFLKVSDVINHSTGQESLLCGWYSPFYILNLMKSIHVLSCSSVPDRAVWPYSKSGLPMVKSVYCRCVFRK